MISQKEVRSLQVHFTGGKTESALRLDRDRVGPITLFSDAGKLGVGQSTAQRVMGWMLGPPTSLFSPTGSVSSWPLPLSTPLM